MRAKERRLNDEGKQASIVLYRQAGQINDIKTCRREGKSIEFLSVLMQSGTTSQSQASTSNKTRIKDVQVYDVKKKIQRGEEEEVDDEDIKDVSRSIYFVMSTQVRMANVV